jgi:cytidylate kinase
MSLITISYSIGSGGDTIAKQVAQRLDLELYDDQKLQQEATDTGIRAEELKSLDEKAPGLLDRLLGSKPELYQDVMESLIYEMSQRGRGVILGHGGQMLLREFGCAFHVFIFASESARTERIMKQRGLTREVAEKMIRKSDNEQKGYFRSTFHTDWNAPSLYDVVINTEKFDTETATKTIVEMVNSKAIKECSTAALEAMQKLSLTKKIQAEFLRNNLSLVQLHVEVPEKGVAHISGITESVANQGRIVEIVKTIPGVSEVQSEVAVVPSYGM